MNAPSHAWPGSRPLKLRISDFELLDRSGAFDGLYKVELIEGTIIAMNAEYRLHGVVKNRLVRLLQRALERIGSELEAFNEIAIQLGDDSLPQPDAIIARAALDRRYFQVCDIALALEVVDRSSRFELTRKVSLYASAGVPELWIADLKTGELNQFWSPQSGAYGEKRRVPLSFELQSVTIAGLVVNGEGLGLP